MPWKLQGKGHSRALSGLQHGPLQQRDGRWSGLCHIRGPHGGLQAAHGLCSHACRARRHCRCAAVLSDSAIKQHVSGLWYERKKTLTAACGRACAMRPRLQRQNSLQVCCNAATLCLRASHRIWVLQGHALLSARMHAVLLMARSCFEHSGC